jgi:hypothetical protein
LAAFARRPSHFRFINIGSLVFQAAVYGFDCFNIAGLPVGPIPAMRLLRRNPTVNNKRAVNQAWHA